MVEGWAEFPVMVEGWAEFFLVVILVVLDT